MDDQGMLVDLLAHQFVDRPETRHDMITDDFDEAAAELEAEVARNGLPDDFSDPVD